MPGQVKTDRLVDDLVADGGKLFDKRARQLTTIVGGLSDANELDGRLEEAFDGRFLGGLGESLFGGSLVAAEAGRRETLKSRKTEKLKLEAFRSPGFQHLSSAMDWQVEVQEYSGPAIEVDFFRLRSFTMANVTDAGVLQSLKDEMQKTLEGGGTFTDFKDRARELLDATTTDAHLRTIYTTNLQTAYNAGKYYEGMDAIEELPYWQYVTVGDNWVRPAHQILEGKVWRKDDPIWDTIYPPNGFNCRCSVLELDEEIVRREKVKIGEPTAFEPDQGFDNNAAADPAILEALARQWQMAERLWEEYQLGELAAQAAPPAFKPFDQSERWELKDEKIGSLQIKDRDGNYIEIVQKAYSPSWVDRITKSITENGWQGPPLIVDGEVGSGDAVLLSGTHRARAWGKLGQRFSDLPVMTWQEMLGDQGLVIEVEASVEDGFSLLDALIKIAPDICERYGVQNQ